MRAVFHTDDEIAAALGICKCEDIFNKFRANSIVSDVTEHFFVIPMIVFASLVEQSRQDR